MSVCKHMSMSVCACAAHACTQAIQGRCIQGRCMSLHLFFELVSLKPTGPVFSAKLEASKAWQSPVSVPPQRWGNRSLWGLLAYSTDLNSGPHDFGSSAFSH